MRILVQSGAPLNNHIKWEPIYLFLTKNSDFHERNRTLSSFGHFSAILKLIYEIPVNICSSLSKLHPYKNFRISK